MTVGLIDLGDIMGLSLASILWVNYNSMGIIDVVRESLESIRELDYPRYEVIVVDNGSSDGSFEAIRSYIGKIGLRAKIIRCSRNLGFTGGNNIAYQLVSKESKYIVLVNNDAVIYPDSLRAMVEFLDSRPRIGAVQGAIYRYGGGEIDSAGGYLNEILLSFHLKIHPGKPIPITYADGAYCVLKRSALIRSGLIDKLFPWETFAFFDDVYLGLKLWSSGFKVYSIPTVVAKHLRGGSFGRVSLLQLYCSLRSWAMRIFMVRTRFKLLALALCLKIALKHGLIKAVFDGYRLARRIGEYFSIENMPVVRLEHLHKIPLYLALRRTIVYDVNSYFIRFLRNI